MSEHTENEYDAIRRTLAQYAQLCDDGRFDDWADLFTEDGRFAVYDQSYTGRDELKNFMEKAQPPERRGKHVIAAAVIDIEGSQARASTDFVFVAKRDGKFIITSAGRYIDRLVRETDRWRFAERRIVMMGE